MKYMLLGALAVSAACGPRGAQADTAAGDVALRVAVAPAGNDLAAAYSGRMTNLDNRIATLKLYVGSIEARIPAAAAANGKQALRRATTVLPPDAFKDVTDEQWARLEAFYDGPVLKRIRLLPPPGAPPRTEEFYYDDGKVVYVFMESDGAPKRDPHIEVDGDAFYFGKDGLIAWILPGGARANPSNVGFKPWNAKLLAEAKRFPLDAKMP